MILVLTQSHTFCSKSSGFDPTPNLNNRWWYWREGRSGFGRFEEDVDGLFFMRGQPPSAVNTAPVHAQARKRARAAAEASDTEVLKSSEN
jgi:hypothetical protein